MVQNMKGDLFQTQLKARGYITLTICQGADAFARRPKRAYKLVRKNTPNNRRPLVPGHINAFSVMAKIIQVQAELPAFFSANDVAKLFDKAWFAIRRQTHDLAFVAVVGKADKLRRGGVNNAGRVWILDLTQKLNRVPFPFGPHRGDEITKAINREQRRTLERRNEKRAGQVRAMMLDVMKFRPQAFGRNTKRPRQVILQVAHFSRVSHAIFQVPEAARPFAIAPTVNRNRGRPDRIVSEHVDSQLAATCFLPPASSNPLRSSPGREQKFLMQM